jgi:hypothetical protein
MLQLQHEYRYEFNGLLGPGSVVSIATAYGLDGLGIVAYERVKSTYVMGCLVCYNNLSGVAEDCPREWTSKYVHIDAAFDVHVTVHR